MFRAPRRGLLCPLPCYALVREGWKGIRYGQYNIPLSLFWKQPLPPWLWPRNACPVNGRGGSCLTGGRAVFVLLNVNIFLWFIHSRVLLIYPIFTHLHYFSKGCIIWGSSSSRRSWAPSTVHSGLSPEPSLNLSDLAILSYQALPAPHLLILGGKVPGHLFYLYQQHPLWFQAVCWL